MIKLGMKFQDIFTRPKEILPDSVRWSNRYSEELVYTVFILINAPGALQFKNNLETRVQG